MSIEVVNGPESAHLLGRRRFLFGSASLAGALCLGFNLPAGTFGRGANAAVIETPINSYILVAADGSVTVMFGGCELGQGSMSGLAQIAAEELKVSWDVVSIEQADASKISYLTAGSGAVRRRFTTMAAAGAAAREMLIAAGAQVMGVSPSVCKAADGKVINTSVTPNDFRTYGELAALAAQQPVPANPPLTQSQDYGLIGTPVPRVDVPSKTDGSALYGLDVRVPGMVYAAIRHCPSLGGTLVKLPSKPRGTIMVVPCTVPETRGANIAGTVNAVAVVADNSWKAIQGARNLRISWQIPSSSSALNSDAILAEAKDLLDSGVAVVAEADGDAVGVLAASSTPVFSATYTLPYVPHVCMEVLNCTVDYRGTSCEIWAPTQGATWVQQTAARVTGLPASAITVHTTFLGGGLGRKIEQDFISQAVEVAMAAGRPFKLMWTR